MAKRFVPPTLISRTFGSPEEIDASIAKLRRRIEELGQLDVESAILQRTGADTVAQSNFRETIRDVFGSASPELKEHEHTRLWSGPMHLGMSDSEIVDGTTRGRVHMIGILKGLIGRLNEKRQDLEPRIAPISPSTEMKTNSMDLTDDRAFARLAIDEAKKSVPEDDGKTHPQVGAVVVKNGQVLALAHRGEEPGNHAEFVALEKKLLNEAVAGATVYTTLEPCTRRNSPKIPCAERLIERKVARVVIGMLDPDPRIRGLGIQRLREANISVTLFPHDLMQEVEELNREFIRFCQAPTLALTKKMLVGKPIPRNQREHDSFERLHQQRENWDFFISHASEDKDAIARGLAEALRAKGKKVWYDDFSLKVGDSLRESIDHGLARSNFGIVILSSQFFEKHWPKKELDGLAAREVNGRKVILPVWHEVRFNEVREYSPTLADRVAVSTDKGLEYVVEKILDSADTQTPTPDIVQPAMQREPIVFEESVYWKVGGDSQKEGPYCPNCYDDKRKEIHLNRGATQGTYSCGICGTGFTTDEYDSRPAKRRPFRRQWKSSLLNPVPKHSHEPFTMQHVFVGQFPEGPKLRLTASRRFGVSQVEYLDENGVRVSSENLSWLNASRLVDGKGQQLEVPIDHTKLMQIHNLRPRTGTTAIPIQLRIHLALDGSEEVRTIPTLLRPGFKNIGNTSTYFMDVIG